MTEKKFKLRAEHIRQLAPRFGGCFATDMITVVGHQVGFMYREQPDFDSDSGWRFFDGSEPQEYLDDKDNIAIYDVNTIANYDPDIIPFLFMPIGMAFERQKSTGKFVEVNFPSDPDDSLD